MGNGTAITVESNSDIQLEGGPDEPNPDGLDDNIIVRQRQVNGDYAQALELYWSDIEFEGYSALKQSELIDVQTCYIGLDADWTEFKSHFLKLPRQTWKPPPVLLEPQRNELAMQPTMGKDSKML